MRIAPEAFIEALFREASPALLRTLYAYTGGRRAISEEALAEAFARALASTRPLRNPLAWIYKTAFRIAAEEMKRERRQSDSPNEPLESQSPGLRDLIGALRKLSPNERAAIIMHYEADLSIREVAARMGISSATVKVHLHRGRRKLQALLGEEEHDE